jgi:hypothetical protein
MIDYLYWWNVVFDGHFLVFGMEYTDTEHSFHTKHIAKYILKKDEVKWRLILIEW